MTQSTASVMMLGPPAVPADLLCLAAHKQSSILPPALQPPKPILYAPLRYAYFVLILGLCKSVDDTLQ